MPKVLDEFVKDRLADPGFYPDKSQEERESIAWAIANKNRDKLAHAPAASRGEMFAISTALDVMGCYGVADAVDEIASNIGEC